MEGDGITSCTGASLVGHEGVDGGAIYAVDDAVIDWACDLVENKALAGPAMCRLIRVAPFGWKKGGSGESGVFFLQLLGEVTLIEVRRFIADSF